MFAGGLARRTAQGRWLYPQPLCGNRLTAIPAIAVSPAIQTLQGRFHLGHFVDVALLLCAAKFRQLPLRRVVLAIRHFMR